MALEVRTGSAQWANESRSMLHVDVRGEGEIDWRRSTISKADPSAEFAAIFERATAETPEYGEIADYVEPDPVEISTAMPLIVMPPIVMPDPPPRPPPTPIDWDAEAARFIAAIFTVRGQNVRGSMHTWVATVALTPDAGRDEFDEQCATMVPALNDWEGAVFAERDRLKALDGATLDDVRWPILPPGAPQFIQWCAAP